LDVLGFNLELGYIKHITTFYVKKYVY